MDFKSLKRFFLFFLLGFLILLNSACSVSSSGKEFSNLNPAPGDSNPQNPDNQSPILVTSPAELIPDAENKTPEVSSEPDLQSPPQASEPPTTQPSLVDLVQPNPELPPILVIEETPITNPIVVESENNEMPINPETSTSPDDQMDSTPAIELADNAESVPEISESESAPQVLVDAIEQIELNDDETDSESDNDLGEKDENSQTEILVEGSCFGKSNAALIFSQKKSKKKESKNSKSKLVTCENGFYKLKIKGKKKHLKHLKVQAAFY